MKETPVCTAVPFIPLFPHNQALVSNSGWGPPMARIPPQADLAPTVDRRRRTIHTIFPANHTFLRPSVCTHNYTFIEGVPAADFLTRMLLTFCRTLLTPLQNIPDIMFSVHSIRNTSQNAEISKLHLSGTIRVEHPILRNTCSHVYVHIVSHVRVSSQQNVSTDFPYRHV